MPDDSRCPQCGTPLKTGALGGLCPACLLKQGASDDTITGGPGAAFTPPTVEELAAKFPQLEILELIGKGGMGAVYKARQKQLDRFVALKILPPGIGDDPAFAERFTREARALAKLSHPNIVTIHDFGQADGLYFLLMEYVDGVTLRQLLNNGRIEPREALAIVPGICDALQFAHDHGIVHRDIKPENILMDRRGRVKVADFGLAKLIGGEGESDGAGEPALDLTGATEVGKVMGTPQYMAPEQRDNPGGVDHRADIYALGVVFYQMLTGQLPGKNLEPPSRKVRIDVRLDEVVLRALEKNPDLRYAQASIFKTQVENATRPSIPEVATAAIPDHGRAGNAVWKNSWIVFAVVAVLLGLFNPFGSKAWGVYGAVAAIWTMLSGIFFQGGNRRSGSGGVIAAIGIVLQFGLLYSIDGMVGLIWDFQQYSSVPMEPHALSSMIARIIQVSLAGWLFGFIGLVLLVIALTGSRYRAPWFYWFLVIYSGFLLFLFPIGTGFAIFFVIYCLGHREEFSESGANLATPGTMRDILEWLALIDEGNYAGSWDGATGYFQRSITRDAWVATLEKVRRPLGEMLSRELNSARLTAGGMRLEVKFDTVFDGLPAATETVTFALQPTGEWKAIGLLIKPREGRSAVTSRKTQAIVGICLGVLLALGVYCIFHVAAIKRRQALTQMLSQGIAAALDANHIHYSQLGIDISGSDENPHCTVMDPTTSRMVDGREVITPLKGEILIHPDGGKWMVQGTEDLSQVHVSITPRPNGWLTAHLGGRNGDASGFLLAGYGFAPVVEREVILNNSGGLDISTGEWIPWKPQRGMNFDSCTQDWEWIGHYKISIMGDTDAAVQGIFFTGSAVREIDGAAWDRSPQEVFKMVSLSTDMRFEAVPPVTLATVFEKTLLPSILPHSLMYLPANRWEPKTYVFRTMQDDFGLLRVGGFTDTSPQRVKISYKLLRKADASKVDGATADSSFPPTLNAAAWLDELQDDKGWQPWTSGGIVSRDELHPLLDTRYPTVAERETFGTGSEMPRYLYLTFSSTEFDRLSANDVTLLRSGGKPVEDPAAIKDCTSLSAQNTPGNSVGWINAIRYVGRVGNLPASVAVQLRYSTGPWRYWNDIPADFTGSMPLDTGVHVTKVGLGDDGKAFIEMVRDPKLDTGTVQWDFLATTQDGRTLERNGINRIKGNDGLAERYIFDAPLAQVKNFQSRKRFIQQVTFPLPIRPGASLRRVIRPAVADATPFSVPPRRIIHPIVPDSTPTPTPGPETSRQVVINIRADGSIILDKKPVDTATLLLELKKLAAAHSDQAVILRSDSSVDYKRVVEVLDLCKQAGITNIAFATGKKND